MGSTTAWRGPWRRPVACSASRASGCGRSSPGRWASCAGRSSCTSWVVTPTRHSTSMRRGPPVAHDLTPRGPTMDLRRYIRDVPGFPRQGIVFKDITPLLADPGALRDAVRQLAELSPAPDAVVAIESRGFVFGTGLALHWGVPLIPA